MCFFFKQTTDYEMRISDWSSDVCSSDLTWRGFAAGRTLQRDPQRRYYAEVTRGKGDSEQFRVCRGSAAFRPPSDRVRDGGAYSNMPKIDNSSLSRSEERLVVKECVCSLRSRCSPYFYKNIFL